MKSSPCMSQATLAVFLLLCTNHELRRSSRFLRKLCIQVSTALFAFQSTV